MLHLRKYIENEFFNYISQKIKQKEQKYNPISKIFKIPERLSVFEILILLLLLEV